ncbi:MAG: hypothetical protein IJ355_07950 [Prevotella sp.]|nr:hypothetical protein [Prevotella sp.]
MKVNSTDTHAIKELVNEKVKYDLIGKLVETTVLTRCVIVPILQKISLNIFYMLKSS